MFHVDTVQEIRLMAAVRRALRAHRGLLRASLALAASALGVTNQNPLMARAGSGVESHVEQSEDVQKIHDAVCKCVC